MIGLVILLHDASRQPTRGNCKAARADRRHIRRAYFLLKCHSIVLILKKSYGNELRQERITFLKTANCSLSLLSRIVLYFVTVTVGIRVRDL